MGDENYYEGGEEGEEEEEEGGKLFFIGLMLAKKLGFQSKPYGQLDQ